MLVVTLVRRFTASVVMEATHGYYMEGGETFVTSMKHGDIFMTIAAPGMLALYNVPPFCGLLPACFPGMGRKIEAAKCQLLVSDCLNTAYAWVKRRVVRPEINVHMCVCVCG